MKPFVGVYESPYLNRTIYYTEKFGLVHREDGPAIIEIFPNGSYFEAWYFNDRLQRYGGPAITHADKNVEYWVHGEQVTDTIETWLSERDYEWDTMSDIEKWELELFMRSL